MALNPKIDELINYLQGTCKSLNEGVIDVFGDEFSEEDLTEQDTSHIDQEIFVCATDGWWYEICDQSEDGENCNDCNLDEEE